MRRNVSSGVVSGGFALIESLISLVVVSVGMVGLYIFQADLTFSTDFARQQSEAVRLADEQIERMRYAAWASLSSGSDTRSDADFYNTTYSRNWTVLGLSTDSQRAVSVRVTWSDRQGVQRDVVINSVIAEFDPALSGSVGFSMPPGQNLKRPKDRSLNIPINALNLGQGVSVLQLAGNLAIVFENSSGYVVKQCATTITEFSQLSGCSTYPAYIITGYLSSTGPTLPAVGVNTSDLSGLNATPICQYRDAFNQSTGAAIAGFKYYICVLPVTNTASGWSGTFRIAGIPTTANLVLCRFEYPASAFITDNERNHQPYSNVTQSLDLQNYILHSSSTGACPVLGGLQTVPHQDCRSSTADRTTQCPAVANPVGI